MQSEPLEIKRLADAAENEACSKEKKKKEEKKGEKKKEKKSMRLILQMR